MNCEDIYPFIYTIKRNKSIGCFVLAYKLIIRGSVYMKKSMKTGVIGFIVATIIIMLVGAYQIGAAQAETVTKTQVKMIVKEVEKEKVVKVVPDGYIALDECIPLEDIACYFIGGYEYPCFELKDIGNQLDNPDNRSYADIMESLQDVTKEYKEKWGW